ncbi:MAG: hopanoid biosynthesis associated radical SAM protein HpnH [Elusimicrobia bacterium GWC2_65_9]|nr:MAG: hopanoid biosynthesis associated radical SAM protein HpnH [Elusimicrobia bacterium GWC2_65_9]
MAMSMQAQLAVFKYLVTQRMKGVEKYPVVMMLEPLFACNLECAACGKIQFPTDILRKRLSPQECFDSVSECGAPVVTVAGGEPLVHAEIDQIVAGLVARKKVVYLCSNALLLEKNLHRFQPSPYLILSIHLDGLEETHDRMVCREGVYKTAISAIKLAKSRGFTVMTNSTIFQGENAQEFRRFFDENMAMGVDGMMISPGYAYEKAPKQDGFLKNEQTKAWFAEALKGRRKKGWVFNHSPFYLDFLEGKRDYDCTPWGLPLRNVFGWQKPCYLMADAGYAKTYQELLETTDWSKYGHAAGNPKCANCMTHCGFEPSAVKESFSSLSKFIEMAYDFATIKGPKQAAGSRG